MKTDFFSLQLLPNVCHLRHVMFALFTVMLNSVTKDIDNTRSQFVPIPTMFTNSPVG